jgi:hypothetical protein
MRRNIILVEGKDDADFVNLLTQSSDIEAFTIEKLGGSNQELLLKKLKSIQNDLQLNPIKKLGLILDLDDYSLETRLEFLNTCIFKVFGQKITKINEMQMFNYLGLEFEIACYFIEPNLDVLVRKVANLVPEIANCLFKCLEKEEIKKKERDKAWTYYYKLWDICNKNERENRSEYVTFKYSASKNAWDLESTELNDIRLFIKQFN